MPKGPVSIPCIEVVCRWYQTTAPKLDSLPFEDAAELLLVAQELGIVGSRERGLVERWSHDCEQGRIEFAGPFFPTALRQLVLRKYDLARDWRSRYLTYWLASSDHPPLDLVATSMVVDLALLDPELISEARLAYAREYYVRHTRLHSDKLAAWAVHGLALAGHRELAFERSREVLARRAKNGSWGSELRRTVGCAFALAASRVLMSDDLVPTFRYADDRIQKGYSLDTSTLAQMLKLLHVVGGIGEERLSGLRRAAAPAERSVFVSYSRRDLEVAAQAKTGLEREPGIKVWLDYSGIAVGDDWPRRISDAINRCDAFLMIVSASALESKYFRKEVLYAVKRRKRLFALMLDRIEVPDELDLLIGDTHVLTVASKAGLDTALAELQALLSERSE